MTTWYSVHHYRPEITAVEAVSETDKFLVFKKERGVGTFREAKNSTFSNWFPTWEQAHAYILDRAEKSLDAARRKVAAAESTLATARAMEPPK